MTQPQIPCWTSSRNAGRLSGARRLRYRRRLLKHRRLLERRPGVDLIALPGKTGLINGLRDESAISVSLTELPRLPAIARQR